VNTEEDGLMEKEQKEKLEAAVAAMSDLIVTTVKTDDRYRFATASRLCEVARSLVASVGTSVDDMAIDQYGHDSHYGVVNGIVNAGVPIAMARNPPVRNYGADNQHWRDAQAAQFTRDQAETDRARAFVRATQSEELRHLLSLRDSGKLTDEQRTIITKRITILFKAMEADHDDVVPADPARGHQPQVGGRQENAPLVGTVVPNGAGGGHAVA